MLTNREKLKGCLNIKASEIEKLPMNRKLLTINTKIKVL